MSESGIAAGVRRIEALTGNGVMEYYKNLESLLNQAAKAAKTSTGELSDKIFHMQNEIKALHSENESLKSKRAQDYIGDVMNQVTEVKGVKLLAVKLENVDVSGLRDLGDQLKEKLEEGVVVLITVNSGKVNLLAMATDGAMKQDVYKRQAHRRQFLRETGLTNKKTAVILQLIRQFYLYQRR